MELKIKDGSFMVEAANIDKMSLTDVINFAKEMYNIHQSVVQQEIMLARGSKCKCGNHANACHTCKGNEDSITQGGGSTATHDAPRDVTIRARIPNENTVDLSGITVKQAVQENAAIRCPECGQAHCAIARPCNSGAMYLMTRDFDDNTFKAAACFDPEKESGMLVELTYDSGKDESKYAFFKKMQEMDADPSVDIILDPESELFCPVCKKSNPFGMWVEAYRKPETFFEGDSICDVCGSVMYEEVNVYNDYSQGMQAVKHANILCCPKCGYRKD